MNAPQPITSLRARDLIEPEACDPIFAEEPDVAPSVAEVGASIAISLKRIADAITGAGENAFTMPLNHYGENIGQCIQGQFERSQR